MPKYLDQNGTEYLVNKINNNNETFLNSHRSHIQIRPEKDFSVTSTQQVIPLPTVASLRGDLFEATSLGIRVKRTSYILITGSIYINKGLQTGDVCFSTFEGSGVEPEIYESWTWSSGKAAGALLFMPLPMVVVSCSPNTLISVTIHNQTASRGNIPNYIQTNLLALEWRND